MPAGYENNFLSLLNSWFARSWEFFFFFLCCILIVLMIYLKKSKKNRHNILKKRERERERGGQVLLEESEGKWKKNGMEAAQWWLIACIIYYKMYASWRAAAVGDISLSLSPLSHRFPCQVFDTYPLAKGRGPVMAAAAAAAVSSSPRVPSTRSGLLPGTAN